MREIKFRAWDGKTMITNQDDLFSYNIEWSKNHLRCFTYTDPYEPEKETEIPLMQYTGIKDCKRTEEYPDGQEIYEGDIIDGLGIVKYFEDGAEFLCEDESGISAIYFGKDMEVIGNIHQNPELIKTK